MHRWVLLGLLIAFLIGMSPGAAPARADGLRQTGTVHVVAWGETLFSIARRYGTTVEAISAVNGITDPTRVYAGQRLTIPAASGASGASSVPAATGGTHTVQRGENLYRIGLRYGVSYWAIARASGVSNPNFILPGWVLCIP